MTNINKQQIQLPFDQNKEYDGTYAFTQAAADVYDTIDDLYQEITVQIKARLQGFIPPEYMQYVTYMNQAPSNGELGQVKWTYKFPKDHGVSSYDRNE